MTATPSLPPRKADGASRAARKGDILKTALLHVALFLLIVVVSYFGTMSLMFLTNEGLGGVANFLLFWVPLPLFVVSIVVSVILLAIHKRAFYVPLLAGAVIVVCAIAGLVLANAAQWGADAGALVTV